MVPPTTIEVPSDDEVEAAAAPVLARGESESLHRLGASEYIEAPLSGGSATTVGAIGRYWCGLNN